MSNPHPTITCRNCGRDRPHCGRGLCSTCYARWTYHGRPDTVPDAQHPGNGHSALELDIDEIAVSRAVAGWLDTPLNPGERRTAIAELRRQGLSQRQIADRLGCAKRTVERHYAALNATTGA